MRTVNILGKDYKLEIHQYKEDRRLHENKWSAYCCSDIPLIVLADFDDFDNFSFLGEEEKDAYAKECLRHEIVHAFLNESGLKDCTNGAENWAGNEEMVDWIAIQFPKMLEVFEKVGAL